MLFLLSLFLNWGSSWWTNPSSVRTTTSLASLYRCCPRLRRGRGRPSGRRRRRSEGVQKEVPRTHPRLSKPQNNCSLRKQGKEGLPWAASAISEGKSKTIPNLPCLRLKRKGRGIVAENRLTLLSAGKVGQEGRHGLVRGEEGWLLSPRAPRGCTQASEQGLQSWGLAPAGCRRLPPKICLVRVISWKPCCYLWILLHTILNAF